MAKYAIVSREMQFYSLYVFKIKFVFFVLLLTCSFVVQDCKAKISEVLIYSRFTSIKCNLRNQQYKPITF